MKKFIFIALAFLASCKSEDTATILENELFVPTVTTEAMISVNDITATSNGIISSNGGAEVEQIGVIWSKTNPINEKTDTRMYFHSNLENFTIDMCGLEPGTTYFVKAFAKNSVGYGYGEILSFQTTN